MVPALSNDVLIWLMVIAAVWTLPWKALALWRAAKNNQKIWFGIFMVINTLAILEILYLFVFNKKSSSNQ